MPERPKNAQNLIEDFQKSKINFWQYIIDWWDPDDKENSICGRKMQKSEVYGLNEILLKV